MIPADGPFIMLDDARAVGAAPARLYRDPVAIIEARDPAEVRPCLDRLREAETRGLHAAGFLSYEAGHALETKLAPLRITPDGDAPPLLWFGLFEGFREIAAEAVPGLLPDPASAWTARPAPLVERADYEAALARVKAHIEAGDIYQANLTFQAEVRTAGSPLAIYAAVRGRARAGYGGVVFTGGHWLLSFSPELFFTLKDGMLRTRPMKGTAERCADPAEDAAAIDLLRSDPKQRAENLMIVDLIRNDLSRVSRPGTVKVPHLFAVETYPTVHQMTSTVVAGLEPGLGPVDVIEAIFPCGSITGAPKIRAMEIIADVEDGPRAVYTGAIGRVAPGGEAAFNVAIRTLTMAAGQDRAIMGLGSGIVADSRAGDEWRECLAKGAFVAGKTRSFDLIETMRFDPRDGIANLDRHLARMKASAEAFGFPFSRHDARNELQAATFRHAVPRVIRMLLSPSGALAIESRPVPETPSEPVEVAITPLPVASDDFRLRHKTSDRAFYDAARRAAGAFETLFEDEAGFLTEGSFTSLFVRRGARLVTPPLRRGLLPGVLRARLLESGEAAEGDLVAADLIDGFFIGNALRGLIPARLCADAGSASAHPALLQKGATEDAMKVDRRTLIAMGGVGLIGGTALFARKSEAREGRFEVTLSEAEWKKRLTPQQFAVLREEHTEPAGSSPLDREKRKGVFVCAGCGLPLYSSATKYDSGTGWPSFWKPLPNAVRTREDGLLFFKRTEVHCRRCGGHLGHVFNDGPRPTGLRYCMNGLAMKFVPARGA